MANIFVSYARKDSKDLAVHLSDDLIRSGHSVWFDLREIELGGNFTEDIEHAIDECDVALVLMSDASSQSSWCRAEQLRALRKGKKVIPLRVQAHSEPPLHLEHLNFIDFSQEALYEAMFRDMLSDISASMAFRSQKATQVTKNSPYKQIAKGGRTQDVKRNAPAFRRHIRQLRSEEWLGLRSWWTYFLFMFMDMHELAKVLQAGEIVAPIIPHKQIKSHSKSQWDRYVRLHFRPRSPELFRSEGFIASRRNPEFHTPMPVYLLFDLEALLLHPQARFSDGDPAKGHSTFATPAAFGELPFEMIYHDSWTRGDEREEIMRYREAQVLIPQRLELEALQLIWVRSQAEYETLHQLLGAELWKKWREKITPRHDFSLFNNKRPYVHHTVLGTNRADVAFNPCQGNECEAFVAHWQVQFADGAVFDWQNEAFTPNQPLSLEWSHTAPYEATLTLDGELAYRGAYKGDLLVL